MNNAKSVSAAIYLDWRWSRTHFSPIIQTGEFQEKSLCLSCGSHSNHSHTAFQKHGKWIMFFPFWETFPQISCKGELQDANTFYFYGSLCLNSFYPTYLQLIEIWVLMKMESSRELPHLLSDRELCVGISVSEWLIIPIPQILVGRSDIFMNEWLLDCSYRILKSIGEIQNIVCPNCVLRTFEYHSDRNKPLVCMHGKFAAGRHQQKI